MRFSRYDLSLCCQTVLISMSIRILVTGGTMDDRHISAKKSKRPWTYVPRMIEEARATVPIVFQLICQKDSRNITGLDRKNLLLAAKASKERHIIITHGTFTMPETAAYLGPKVKGKVIVLTGSAVPFVKKNSDAMFNLGAAIAAVQLLENGVYVIMNGRIFNWKSVKKDLRTGKFVEKK